MINIQPIEKSVTHDGTTLDVHSIFLTIQGEGPFTGRAAVFIRLAGCNLACPGCDTEYTQGRQQTDVKQILRKVQALAGYDKTSPDLVVITGGEPFRQNLLPLVSALLYDNYSVQIETNGTLAPLIPQENPYFWGDVVIVCSPKAGKVNSWVERNASCYKYVLSHDSVDPEDGLPILALGHSANPRVARPPQDMLVYLQPMDAQDLAENKKNIDACVVSCLKYNYLFQLQVHKYIGVA